MTKQKVLFVCLGNICRSPMAEAIFSDMIKKENLTDHFDCDSAGTANYHVGDIPDHRTIKTLAKYNIATGHLGRQFKAADFKAFDYIFAMDRVNLQNILSLAKSEEDSRKVKLIRYYDSTTPGNDVPDPYYGNMDNFEETYRMLERCCRTFMNELKKSVGIVKKQE